MPTATTTTTTTMATSPRTITTVRRTSAPRVLLAARAHIDLHEKGLAAFTGAREIIAAIRSRKTVTKLILGHNNLGDDGCRELFHFLCSGEGRRYRIAEISLNSNRIGDDGLEAIAEYLEGNEHLRELFLQNNAFQGETEVAVKLSSAINVSKLELLSLASNQQLSDAFYMPFIGHLDSSSLRELQISALGLTRVSAPALTAYCTSPRSRALETLKCNGNTLGIRAVRSFLAALRTANFTLLKLEVYANADLRVRAVDGDAEGEDIEESVEEARARWMASERDHKNVCVRNELLRRKVQEEALALLSYSRALLLSASQHSYPQSQPSPSQIPPIPNPSHQNGPLSPTSSIPASTPLPLSEFASPTAPTSASPFPFLTLPGELQQYILSLLAPSLSARQRTRVFDFAADPATLRPLLPSLRLSSPRSGCIPDPASLPFGSASAGGSASPELILGMGPFSPAPISKTSSPTVSPKSVGGMGVGMGIGGSLMDFAPRTSTNASPCAGGRCMGAGGSVLCHRAEVRMRWLTGVGCVRFDADGRGEADVLQLLAP